MRITLLSALLATWCFGIPARAQEGAMTISVSSGASLLFFRDVDDDGRKDIDAYNRLGIPVGQYEPFNAAPSFEGGIEFRFDRDIAFRLFGLSMTAESRTSYADTTVQLSLVREIRTKDVGFDLLYFFPPLVYDLEVSAFVGIGRMTGSATQTTYQQHQEKSADSTITVLDQDAFASYKKTKLYVRGGARLTWMFAPPFSALFQAVYKYAPMGHLDGTLREVTLVREHTTTIEFDYSTFDLKVGLSLTI